MDIIFFAAIAFFIFYKLSKEFGKVDENERAEIKKKMEQRREALVEIQRQLSQQQVKSTEEMKVVGAKDSAVSEEKFFVGLDQVHKQNFINILQSSKITAEFFVNGTKSAFEMIIKAFAAEDLATLKFLLAEKIYQGFETAVNQRKEQEKTLVTNLISIEKAEVTSAMIFGNLASVAVKIVSKQINYITNKSGEIVEGRKDEINEITDVWTFKRDLNSQNPNWVVSVTGAAS